MKKELFLKSLNLKKVSVTNLSKQSRIIGGNDSLQLCPTDGSQCWCPTNLETNLDCCASGGGTTSLTIQHPDY